MISSNRKAECFKEAFPIGNGRLGAMIYGGTDFETILLNQDSIWYGGFTDRINPDALPNLEKIRSLILSGKIEEAEKLLRYSFSGTPQSERPYQMLADLQISYSNKERIEINDYRRTLNLDDGIVEERFCYKEGTEKGWIQKEYLASYPMGILVVHIKCSNSKISFEALLQRKRFYDHAGKMDDSTIYLDGNLGRGGVDFLTGVRAETPDGTIEVIGEHLLVRDASEITLYIACETSFYSEHFREAVREKLDAAQRIKFAEIKKQHVKDYRQLYGRVVFQLKGEENTYVEDYFQYGRYLMIAGSREGSLPLNLQGIWNAEMESPWDSKYTININTEMNYWMAETCNLSECHLPLFEHLIRMLPNGREVAEKMYGCRGFMAHHNTDLWGDCAPQDICTQSTYWPMGGAWLCTHIWVHYLYTADKQFLEKMYPVLKDAVLFFHDFLIEDQGELVTCPSLSPENAYIMQNCMRGSVCAGPSMDSQILRDLFEGFIRSSEELGIFDEIVENTVRILNRLPEIKVGRNGQIMEWREDYEEVDPGHRHISQLYALHPAHQISVDKTPELAKAALNTLERRLAYGGGYTGWSCAWIVNFYARLGEGEKALSNLKKLWRESTFPNRMSNHPYGDGYVFQIDGNLGATAAIVEMLVQADEDRVLLLPALPSEWAAGKIKGVRIPGNAEISLEWEDCKLMHCEIKANQDYKGKLYYQGHCYEIQMKKGEQCYVV